MTGDFAAVKRRMLEDLKALNCPGALLVNDRPGDVPFLALPTGAEICADGTGTYDIWADGEPAVFGLTREAINLIAGGAA